MYCDMHEALHKALHKVLHEALHEALHKALHEALHEALHKALHKALRTKALHEALREALRTEALHEALRTEALHEAPHRVPAIFPIASTRASAKYTPYIATLFFTHPSFLTSSLPRKALERQPAEDCRQNQTTVARTRRPPFKRPSSERHERFNQSIDRIEPELRYRPVAESNQGLLGRHPRRPPFECTASERP